MKILVVDDNRNDLELITYHLRGMGECVSVSNRLELAGALELGPFDVAILDFWIPQLAWPDSMRLIREKLPDCPVIVISGAIIDDVQGYQAVRDGADDFIMKDHMQNLAHAVRLTVIRRLAKTERESSIDRITGPRDVELD